MFKEITNENCNTLLRKLDLKFCFDSLSALDGNDLSNSFDFVQGEYTRDTDALFDLSLRLVDWLPHGGWWVLIFNSFSFFDEVQTRFISKEIEWLEENLINRELSGKVFAFETLYEDPSCCDRMKAASLMFWILVFEGHCQIVSSNSSNGNFITIADGTANLAIRKFPEKGQFFLAEKIVDINLGEPQWAVELNISRQESMSAQPK
jgi:hypothetical protein